MATPTEGPFGTYADVTGVVDATAAAEVVVLVAALKAFLPDTTPATDESGADPAPSPDFDAIPPATRDLLRAEIDAVAAAIAAAPTS